MRGHVTRLVSDKGFGFIAVEGGKDHFFHRSEFTGTFEDLQAGGKAGGGTAVEFDSVESPKGHRAENVRAVE